MKFFTKSRALRIEDDRSALGFAQKRIEDSLHEIVLQAALEVSWWSLTCPSLSI